MKTFVSIRLSLELRSCELEIANLVSPDKAFNFLVTNPYLER